MRWWGMPIVAAGRSRIHANGDRSPDMVLDAYEAAQVRYPRSDARLRIETLCPFPEP